jgi:hypothetical protein
MGKILQAAMEILKSGPRLLGTLLMSSGVALGAWLMFPQAILSDPVRSILLGIFLLSLMGLLTYPIGWAGKWGVNEWRERTWRKTLPLLSAAEKHQLQAAVELGNRPHWVSLRNWNYLVSHVELIATPEKQRHRAGPSWFDRRY